MVLDVKLLSSVNQRVPYRLLFYAVNGLGLGHVTRLLAIAHAMRIRCPEAQILFITSSEAEDVIYKEGFAALKVPSQTSAALGRLRPQTYTKLVQSVVWNATAAFNPAILIVDTFPAGTLQELLPTLRWEMRRVFVYRAQQADKERDAFFQSTLSLYDLAVIPHPEGTEDILLPSGLASVWAGDILIRTRAQALPRTGARTRLGLPPNGKILYVTFGGGGDQEMQEALSATFEALAGSPWYLAVSRAPLDRQEPRPLPPNAQWVSYYPMSECFAAFDGAISAAGYNSVAELLHHGIPSVLIPFVRGLDDQFGRVQKMAAAGAAIAGTLEAASLRAAITQIDDPITAEKLRRHSMAMISADGADRAADAILGLL